MLLLLGDHRPVLQGLAQLATNVLQPGVDIGLALEGAARQVDELHLGLHLLGGLDQHLVEAAGQRGDAIGQGIGAHMVEGLQHLVGNTEGDLGGIVGGQALGGQQVVALVR